MHDLLRPVSAFLTWLLCLLAFDLAINAEELSKVQGPVLFKAINLNGPSLVINGQEWQAENESGVETSAKVFEKQEIKLIPPVDDALAQMIRSSRWGTDMNVTLKDVPEGIYQVFLYCWEDNNPEKFAVNLNGRTVLLEYDSGSTGKWQRLGPWRTVVRDGVIRIAAYGGAANFSGIEIWAGDGEVPDPYSSRFVSSVTEEQLTFFESRIRPLLIEHCYSCHSIDADEPAGGLLVDSRAGIIKGGTSDRLIYPGSPEHSLLIKAVRHEVEKLQMPPEEKLSDQQIADLEKWVQMGAPDPRTEDTIAELKRREELNWEQARDFWSLRPLAAVSPPNVKDVDWPISDLDRFVLRRIEDNSLTPVADADRRTLIRRATFDLTGLPPTPQEVEEFENDASPDAYEKLVNRLLESKRYGERWGRYWLDIVRYSDTAGDNSDFPVPQIYLYRNWVIDAFNADMPYDQFITEQLAGDLIGGNSEEQIRSRLIATGYIANSRRFGSRVDDYPQHLTIEDTLDNLGKTFMASTINCARCHNHKFDPFTTEDYYALYGIFHSTRYPWPGIELDQKQRDFVSLADESLVKQVIDDRTSRRKDLEEKENVAKTAYEEAKGNNVDDARLKELETAWNEAKASLKALEAEPLPYETYYAVADSKNIEDVAVQIKGDPGKSGAVVPRRFLSVLGGQELDDSDTSSGRLQLAKWIISKDNPLTARVIVNRIWAKHFGVGIVPTANDFGRQGKPPTHPELLDWLSKEFLDNGWSIKQLHRTIMLSRTYQLSSLRNSAMEEIDPSNVWLSAFPRRRLDAESIRDTMLYVSGDLDESVGGEHPFPAMKDWNFTQHNPFKAIYETNRRSVYMMTQRIQRHPYLAIFDGADPAMSTPVRLTSTTPLQALYLMNDKFVHDRAERITNRILQSNVKDQDRFQFVWRLLLGRSPSLAELDEMVAAKEKIHEEYDNEGNNKETAEKLAWEAVVRSLLRLNEFVYID